MLGIDYAWQHPDPAALAAAGYQFACRYLSRDATKNLTLSEAASLAAHDVWVVANWEYGAQDMLRGYAGGVADAQLALRQATAAGMPRGRPIYFSADWDVTPAQEAAVTDYLRGAASVLGAGDVGEYGGYYPVRIARDNGAAAWTWQTSAWSGGQWDPRDTIRQTGSATVGGVQVDVDEALVPDVGQWQPGRTPVVPNPQHLQEIMIMQDVLFDVQPAAGGAAYGIWYRDSAGRYGHVATPSDVEAIKQLVPGIPERPISASLHELFVAMSAQAAVNVGQLASAVTARIGADLAKG
ncbi:DUF1906 domain-containing protein [Actinocrinis puniceicyclus]|uniref:DUF1906 domain-containing protein n=1 Tax=Actinocrinis puniceicyclus TaxID=977794 RepID=A0A8J8BBL4_9ACTN|nr:DUF1906 domain-containing protein [Actinocrinis puniceicyclus]MBS2962590.1 DUF1906 domain-containing protein [Actinocrinis puniceicyclus]